MKAAFIAASLLGAALLFLLEPAFGKLLLPRFGGTPLVWNGAVVFFQAALLLAYFLADRVARLPEKAQPLVAGLVLLAPWVAFPLGVPQTVDGHPVLALFRVLALRAGPPFLAVAFLGPLLQRWFARSGEDPYFLYAASNAGSVAGLLAYPLVVEPRLTLARQGWAWFAGYGALVVLAAACARLAPRETAPPPETPSSEEIPVARRVRWVFLAAAPSALLLGVTTFLTTDVAAIPLFWVVPLALYLLTYVIAFAPRPLVPHALAVQLLPKAAVLVTCAMVAFPRADLLTALVHLAGFTVAALVCHGALARERPEGRALTRFSLHVALGGVLGGAATALLAPLLFRGAAEYPIALVLATLALPWRGPRYQKGDVLFPVALGLAVFLAPRLFPGIKEDPWTLAGVTALVPAAGCLRFAPRPARFAGGLAAVLLAASAGLAWDGGLVATERSWFGVHRVFREDLGGFAFHALSHGTTRHGRQRIDPRTGAPILPEEPLTYFHRTGPAGEAIAALASTTPGKRVAVVGLGAGSLAAYASPGQSFTFYEIDPTVERLALDPRYFSFVAAARKRGAAVPIILGDARLSLARATETYDLIVLDAFSSDAIPAHLLTVEAVTQVYRPRLAPGGAILFHVTNEYLLLAPVVGDVARAAGLPALACPDVATEEEKRAGKSSSLWVLVGRDRLGPGWLPLRGAGRAPWTDDFSNVLEALAR